MSMIKVGSDFSGIGAFNQALMRLGIEYEEVFACELDRYARQTFVHNYGAPKYYPKNVYEREIPNESLDIYMTSPPCQSFSLAGKRKGEEDERGILFYNSHEFIKVNKPRYFIFENVKGLLSDDNGNTFAKWVQYLGGKSVNGLPTIFPHREAVPYHIYWKVLNAKNYGIPQNRERVFIVGIRDDEDNNFSWPKEEFLTKRLRDVLESDVDEKYFLSEKMIESLVNHYDKHKEKGNGFKFEPKDLNDIGNSVTTKSGQRTTDNFLRIKSANSIGYEVAKVYEDSINLEHPNSLTRRGRVGKLVAQTLNTKCNQGIAELQYVGSLYENNSDAGRIYSVDGISCTLKSEGGGRGAKTGLYLDKYRIRKLTPRECFRLMDFPDTFSWPVSDSQAYKQAGNSICVGVLARIIQKLMIGR